jgi:predicted nucleic acid-binding protein
MKYLVDANVLSEPTKPLPDPRVVDWLRAHEAHTAVDPCFSGNCASAFLSSPKEGSGRRWNAGSIQESAVSTAFPWMTDTGLKWAELLARLHKAGKAMPIKDSLKAATAIAQGLAVATRNRIEFAKACVPVIDPFVG